MTTAGSTVVSSTSGEGGEECDCGITDAFGRALAGSWGVSDAGYAWSATGGAAESYVNGTEGVVEALSTSSGNPRQDLIYQGTLGLDQRVLVRLELVVTSSSNDRGNVQCGGGYVLQFFSNNQLLYQAPGSGPFIVSGPVNFQAYFWLRMEGTPAAFSFKLWQDGDPEPAAWFATLPGSALRDTSFVRFGATRNTVQPSTKLIVDNLDIEGVDRCGAVQFDDFNRIVAANGWGVSTYGAAWTLFGGGTRSQSVDGSAGLLSATGFNSNAGAQIVAGLPPWASGHFTMTCVFSMSSWSDVDVFIGFYLAGGGNRNVNMTGNTGGTIVNVGVGARNTGLGGSTSFSPAASTQYVFKYDFHRADDHVRWKVWALGAAEPSTWATDVDDAGPGDLAGGGVFAQAYSLSAANVVLKIDSIEFDYDGKPCYQGGPQPTPASVPAVVVTGTAAIG